MLNIWAFRSMLMVAYMFAVFLFQMFGIVETVSGSTIAEKKKVLLFFLNHISLRIFQNRVFCCSFLEYLLRKNLELQKYLLQRIPVLKTPR